MTDRDIRREINTALSRLDSDWVRSPIWGELGEQQQIRPVDRLYASIAILIGDEHIEHASLEAPFDMISRTAREAFAYEVTIWTPTRVIHAIGNATPKWPTVNVVARASLRKVSVGRAPVQAPDVFGTQEDHTEVSFEYDGLTVLATDYRGQWLPEALPSLLADLTDQQ